MTGSTLTTSDPREDGSPAPGDVLGRKYRLMRLLGEGSYAWVYAASHESVESLRFAVKILKPAHSNNADVLRRFRQEANTVAALQSRHAVKVFDFGVAESGLPFIVMEFIRGLSLRQLLQREGRLHPLTTARLTAGILKALVEAHANGIVHRDLKPSNILVTKPQDEPRPIAKVLDFGIAKVVSADGPGGMNAEETVEGLLFCSPRYASPEILDGKPALQSDLYSLGHVMAEMLEGEPPYNDDNAILVAARHLSDDPVPLGPRVVESGFYHVVRRACEKKLDARYATAEEMLLDLERSITRLQALSNRDPNTTYSPVVDAGQSGPFVLQKRAPVSIDTPDAASASATQPVAARDLKRSIQEALDRQEGAPPIAKATEAAVSALLEEGEMDAADGQDETPLHAEAPRTPTPSRRTPSSDAATPVKGAPSAPVTAPVSRPNLTPVQQPAAIVLDEPLVSNASPVLVAPVAAPRRNRAVLVTAGLLVATAIAAAAVLLPKLTTAGVDDRAAASVSAAVATPDPAVRDAIRAATLRLRPLASPSRSRLTLRAPVPDATAQVGNYSIAQLPLENVWFPVAEAVEIRVQATGHQDWVTVVNRPGVYNFQASLLPASPAAAEPVLGAGEPEGQPEPADPAGAALQVVAEPAVPVAPPTQRRPAPRRPTTPVEAATETPAAQTRPVAEPTPAQPATPTPAGRETFGDELRHSDIRNPFRR